MRINPFIRCPNEKCGRFHVVTFVMSGFHCTCGMYIKPWERYK